MKRALIIEGNMLIGRELSQRLAELGFDSLHHAWTENEAVAMSERHPPDLVVVGDELDEGNGVTVARRICAARDVPILLATRDSFRIGECLSLGGVLDGPYSFSKLPETVFLALHDPQSV